MAPEAHLQPPDGPGKLLAEAALAVNAILGGVFALVVGLLLAELLPTKTVPAWLAVSLLIVLLALISAVMTALFRACSQATRIHGAREQQTPRVAVRSASKPYPPYQSTHLVLIVEWSGTAAMPPGGAVIIAVAEEHHERPLGYGTVRAQQTDGKVVVTLDIMHDGADHYVNQLLDADQRTSLLARVRLGGTILAEHLDAVRQHRAMPPTSAEPSVGAEPREI